MTEEPERPSAPMNLPKYLREGLDKQSPDRLRTAAEYATRLAAWKEDKAERELEERTGEDVDDVPDGWESDAEEWEEVVEKAREKADIQGKGYRTKKRIDGRDYWYLQWREGEHVRSKYIAPVNPANTD